MDKSIIDAYATDISEFLSKAGIGLYIPAYQREYSWDKTHITRLFDDVGQGLEYFLKADDAITFIGAMICIQDTRFETVHPQLKDQTPPVLLVIDGQQRLTTILLMMTVLREALVKRSYSISKFLSDEKYDWIHDRALQLIGLLSNTYKIDQSVGDLAYRYYPKMIRSDFDQWSRKERTAIYSSPVAKYLHAVIKKEIDESVDEKLRAKLLDYADISEGKEEHKVIVENIKTIRKLIDKLVCENSYSDYEYPTTKELLKSNQVQSKIFSDSIPEEVENFLRANQEDKNYKTFEELFRLIVFSDFVLKRIAVTIVDAKNEDYAFDMFEALNTTGEPLTAFETFKPKIVQAEGLGAFKGSDSERYIRKIEEVIGHGSDAAKKQKATSDLLVPFALLFNGEKLSRHLSKQRRYLRDKYESLKEGDRGSFVQHLAFMAEFFESYWPEGKADEIEYSFSSGLDKSEIDGAELSLSFLRAAKHTIAIPLLARYFSAIKTAKGSELKEAYLEFVNVCKATAAFFFLWRSGHETTAGIDSHYRKLMERGMESIALKPLCVEANSLAPSGKVKEAFRNLLSEAGIGTRDNWVSSATSLPQYSKNVVAKLFMLAYMHDSTIDDSPGLMKKGRQGTAKTLKLENWLNALKYEIEHVAPDKNSEGNWDLSIYEERSNLDGIGNLTLLPKLENIVVSNRDWPSKRAIYTVLASATQDEFDASISALSETVDLTERSQQIIENSEYLNEIRSLSNRSGDWNLEFIKTRSRRMSELAWDNMYSWLN